MIATNSSEELMTDDPTLLLLKESEQYKKKLEKRKTIKLRKERVTIKESTELNNLIKDKEIKSEEDKAAEKIQAIARGKQHRKQISFMRQNPPLTKNHVEKGLSTLAKHPILLKHAFVQLNASVSSNSFYFIYVDRIFFLRDYT